MALVPDVGLDATSPPSNISPNTSSIPSTILSLHPSAPSLPTLRLVNELPPSCCPVISWGDGAETFEDGTFVDVVMLLLDAVVGTFDVVTLLLDAVVGMFDVVTLLLDAVVGTLGDG